MALLFRKLQTVKGWVRPLFEKYRFRTTFESQHSKGSQTLVNFGSENFHHTFSLL